uniref:Titin,Titin,Titin n=1 Tax=Homo sapiens TaxID=9606 RepID=UPI0010671A10|nr:Chain A, Titin,Titin,Titin [Homo sapiens]6FWX_B Chain B, Titin,Titin,Titin [Homo sapiens]
MTTQAPTFTQPLQSVVVLEGSTATFEAHISGFPVPEVSWFRDGQVISTSTLPGVQISFSDGRAKLTIPAVTKANSGRYSLKATNGSGQATSTAELLVKAETAPPNFVQRLQSMTVRQGSQVRLQVRVTGIPTPVVKFYRDGAEIQSSLDFQISQEGDLYSLLIAEAYPEDSGTYSVNATNSVGRATSTAELLVQGETTQAPTFTQPLQSVVVLEGSTATFEAHISGFPVPEVSWFRDGQVISSGRGDSSPGVQISFSDGRAKLTIPAVTKANSGRYSLKATNGSGQATSTAELLVKAETAPPNFVQRLQSMTVRQGSQVRLQVRVTGIPTPVVKFYRDGAEIQSSLDFQISQEGDLYSLLIAEAYPEDSGTYSVNATNSVGRATSTAELLVQGE